MLEARNFKILKEDCKAVFKSIEDYINSDINNKDYLKITSKDDLSIDFKIGSNTFTLMAEIGSDYVIYKTYKLILNPTASNKYDINQIIEFDMVGDLEQRLKFIQKKEDEVEGLTNFIGKLKTESGKMIGKRYIFQIMKYLKTIWEEENKNIKERLKNN